MRVFILLFCSLFSHDAAILSRTVVVFPYYFPPIGKAMELNVEIILDVFVGARASARNMSYFVYLSFSGSCKISSSHFATTLLSLNALQAMRLHREDHSDAFYEFSMRGMLPYQMNA